MNKLLSKKIEVPKSILSILGSGRATRAHLWLVLIALLLGNGLVLQLVENAREYTGGKIIAEKAAPFYAIAFLYILIVTLIKRVHDLGHSAWCILVMGLTLPLQILFLVTKSCVFTQDENLLYRCICSHGTSGTNKYGFDPRTGKNISGVKETRDGESSESHGPVA